MHTHSRDALVMLAGLLILLGANAGWCQEKAKDATLVFHAPFDGKLEAMCDGKTVSALNVPDCRFEPGPVGQAVVIVTDAVAYAESDSFPLGQGTVAFWIKPHWMPPGSGVAQWVIHKFEKWAVNNSGWPYHRVYAMAKGPSL